MRQVSVTIEDSRARLGTTKRVSQRYMSLHRDIEQEVLQPSSDAGILEESRNTWELACPKIECGEARAKGPSSQPRQEPCTNVRRTQQYGHMPLFRTTAARARASVVAQQTG